ncbi:hypothetical protein U9R62_02510 [Cylindrospermopsis raciborskii DSH]|uniref:hypothetical protein n=1 Tax=Cylindrospermopsis raciborskii TaxID=77022 RepID=UPI002EDAE06F
MYLFKENVTAEDRRMDLVVTYNNQRYVIELKIWYGEKRLQDGLDQLCSYPDSYRLNEGHIIVANFNKNGRLRYTENCSPWRNVLLLSSSSQLLDAIAQCNLPSVK